MLNSLGKFFGISAAAGCGDRYEDVCVQATCYTSSAKYNYEKIRHEYIGKTPCNSYEIGCCK
ncbi:hypothetical protein J31TS6_36760 [Brevibacillus reuszeri]|nr:hypothetical protein J31TS6_36760 [Brevibacillus reuszeri]